MKRSKKLLSLLLVLVLVIGAAWAATLLNSDNQTQEEETSYTTIFTLEADTVTSLGWDYNESITFKKDEDAWVYAADPVFPVEESYLETMLSTLSSILSYKTIEAPEDLAEYGLDVPVCIITVTGGETYTLSIGNETGMGGERYFSTGDGNVYLVASTVLDPFCYDLYDILAYEAIPDLSAATALTVGSEKQSYTISNLEYSGLSYSDSYVWFMDDRTLDTELTEALLENVTGLYWYNCVNYNTSDLAEYGLDAPVVTASVTYPGGVFTLEIGDTVSGYSYARIAGSHMVYQIDPSIAETLMHTTYQELQPDEVLLMDWDAVTSMEITLDGSLYEIVRSTKTVTAEDGTESEETVFLLGEKEITPDNITGILDSMEGTGYAYGLTPEGSEELRLLIHRDHETFPEVALVFYTYDSTSCMVTLNGEATVFTARTDVVNLVEAVNKQILE